MNGKELWISLLTIICITMIISSNGLMDDNIKDGNTTSTCDQLGPGYYCLDESIYLQCNKDNQNRLMKCRYPLKCKCGKSQLSSSSPCRWRFFNHRHHHDEDEDCIGKPGQFISITSSDKQNPMNQNKIGRRKEERRINSEQLNAFDNREDKQRSGKEMQHVVSYFDNWSQYHTASLNGKSCRFVPSNIDGSYITNLIYAFAVFDNNFNMKTYEWNDEEMYAQVMAKKTQFPHMKVSIAVGGWNFNAMDATKHLFSEMASTKENRDKFIRSAIAFAHKYNFDGIDIDWEYPGWPDQGGQPRDTENFSLLLKEFRAAINADTHPTKLLLTVASPAGEEKINLIQLDKIHQYVDWFNLMGYDFHGSWDSVTGPHSALHSSDGLNTAHALDLYIAAGVPPSKIVAGLALYGRVWTIEKTDKIEYGVKASGAGKPGVCTQEASVLNQLEIRNLIGTNYKIDKDSQTVIGWSGDQFVTFENTETLGAKIDYFCQHGLGGVMTWAMSMDVDFELMKYVYTKATTCSIPTPDPGSSSSSDDGGGCIDANKCNTEMLECIKHVETGKECTCTDKWTTCLSKNDCN